jgi:hypothetical protein
MAGTLDRPTASPEAPPPSPPPEVTAPDDASRLCATCAALLAEGQDWCLECGTAQPGRIGAKPGWRPALTVVLLTAVLAAGAVAAAYAALSSDAERQASAPAPPSAAPVVPPAPVQPAPAPADTTPEVAAPQDDADAPETPRAPERDEPDPPAASPSSPPSSGDTDTGGDAGDDSGSGSGSADEDEGTQNETRREPAIVALGPDAASTYDPFDRAGGLTGDPADAIDGRRRTKWEAPVGQDGLVNIGLLVSLEQAKAFEKVRVQAGTPGFTVVLYGSKRGTAPEGDPAQTAAWEKLDETRDFGTDEKLGMGEGKWRHVLLWFTDQPADTKVMIPEVSLLKK